MGDSGGTPGCTRRRTLLKVSPLTWTEEKTRKLIVSFQMSNQNKPETESPRLPGRASLERVGNKRREEPFSCHQVDLIKLRTIKLKTILQSENM